PMPLEAPVIRVRRPCRERIIRRAPQRLIDLVPMKLLGQSARPETLPASPNNPILPEFARCLTTFIPQNPRSFAFLLTLRPVRRHSANRRQNRHRACAFAALTAY